MASIFACRVDFSHRDTTAASQRPRGAPQSEIRGSCSPHGGLLLQGERYHDAVVSIGLTPREIGKVAAHLPTLLEKVDNGDVQIFVPKKVFPT